MSAPVLRWQMISPDPARATDFYRSLFGWTVSTANALGYREVETGGTPGGVWPSPPGAPAMLQLFVGVPDVEEAVAKAVGLGAKVIVPVTALPDGDVMAVLADPGGLTFGLMRHES
jgi:predicted enzyme related to lactoylglutathione lyase